MRAIVAQGHGAWTIADVPDPRPGHEEVVVAPAAVGICGSDLHIIDHQLPDARYPLIPGHEIAGVVVEVGAGVDDWLPGDQVAVDPSIYCGHCRYCQNGRGNLCARRSAVGVTVPGGFAERVSVPQRCLHRIPTGQDLNTAALTEPMACVVRGLTRMNMAVGSDLLVVGAGTMGLMMMRAARYAGAATVSVTDTDPTRQAIAHNLGADSTATEVAHLLADRPAGFDYAVEATGRAEAAHSALAGLDRGGTLLIFGVAATGSALQVSQFRLYREEITILGSMAVLDSFAPAQRLLAADQTTMAGFVTHRFPLEAFGDALAAVRARRGLKVQLQF